MTTPASDRSLADRGLFFRSAPIAPAGAPATLNDDERSVEIIAATENPVLMFDWERGEYVPEVLLMSGARLPEDRTAPLLNAHNRLSAADVIGSVRDLRVERGALVGKSVFSSAAESEYVKVKEGHLRDLSIGYRVLKKRHVPAGESMTLGGKSFTGPVNVVTHWRVFEVSVTPIGADSAAKTRSIDLDVPEDAPIGADRKENGMDKLLRKVLVDLGAPEDGDEAALRHWAVEHGAKDGADEQLREWAVEQKTPLHAPKKLATSDADGRQEHAADIAKIAAEAARRAAEEAAEAFLLQIRKEREEEKKLRDEICSLSTQHRCSDNERTLLEAATSIEEARKIMLKILAERDSNNRVVPDIEDIRPGASQRDKHFAALKHSFVSRAIGNVVRNQALASELRSDLPKADGVDYFRNATMLDIARECVQLDGYNVRGWSREQIAKVALGFPHQAGISYADIRAAGGLHTTSSFGELTLDAVNKTMLAGYREFPATWRQVFRQAQSAPDFKNIHRIRLSEAPNLMAWPNNKAPEEIAFADEKETYAVEAYANIASFGWQLLVNDDMDALTRIPMLMGAAAERTFNALAWAQITSNPTMTDGQALFLETPTGNRKKANLVTGSATPTVSTVGTLKKLIRLQVGVNQPDGSASEAILGLEPRFLVGPAALETTILQLVNSVADPAANLSSGVANPVRTLTPVIEPLLDANSATAFYLFCSPTQIDTVEVTYLQGYETPRTESWRDEKTSALNYKIVQCGAAKAIDHRGMAKHAGA